MMEARICRIAGDLSVFRDGRSMAREILDALIVFLEFCYREIVILDSFDELSDMQRKCLGHTRNALSTLRLLEEGNIVRSSTTIEIVPNQGAGRPTNLIHFSKSLFYILYSYHLFNLKSDFLIMN